MPFGSGLRLPVAMAAALFLSGCVSATDVFGDARQGYLNPARAADADFARAETVPVTLSEYAFAPAALSVKAGRPYVLRLENKGTKAHFFSSVPFFKAIAVRSLSGHAGQGEIAAPYLKTIGLAAGETRELAFVPLAKGTYDFECTAPFHADFGMTGTVTIE
ncbi:MAG: plastocyanin/azurin family copper-binding protein [Alphaproteobacteria bacterium]